MPTWVGDACMATPTLRAVRQAFPSDHITIISRPVIAELLSGLDSPAAGSLFDDNLTFQKRGMRNRIRLAGQLRKQQLDKVILLTNSLWSAGVVRLAGIRNLIGYNRDARGWLLSEPVSVPQSGSGNAPISPVDYYLGLAGWIGSDTTDRSMQLHVSDKDTAAADNLWARLGWKSDDPVLVINNNAATEKNRTWPADRTLELATRVATQRNWNVLLHCGPGERDVAGWVARQANDPRIASMGVLEQLPIGLSKAVLQKASVVVSSDSGPRHIAVACNRPVIGLYGATDPAWTKTFNLPEITLQANAPARASSSASLAQPGKMQDISVGRVMIALESIVESQRRVA